MMEVFEEGVGEGAVRIGCGGREERLERRRIVPAEFGCGGREERLERRRIVPAKFGCGERNGCSGGASSRFGITRGRI